MHVALRSELRILGVRVDNVRLDEAVSHIVDHAGEASRTPCQMAFVNAHCFNEACADRAYHDILRRARWVFPDGIGVRLAARAHGVGLRENVNGTDLFPRLCSVLPGSGIGMFLLGGRPGVVDGVAAWLRRAHPGVDLCGMHHGFFPRSEDASMARRIRRSGARLLLVAMGVPQQEKWIDANLASCGVNVAIGVGALFDFYSAAVPRAPFWMRRRGLEWVFRLCLEPARMWRRYLVGNPQFLYRVARQRLGRVFAR